MSAGAVEGSQGPGDYAEIMQLENYAPAIPVTLECVETVVPVQIAQAASGRTTGVLLTFANQTGTKLMNANEQRGDTTIVGGNDFYLGFTKAECEGKSCTIPGKTPIRIRNGEQIWVMAAVADTYVSAIADMWTR